MRSDEEHESRVSRLLPLLRQVYLAPSRPTSVVKRAQGVATKTTRRELRKPLRQSILLGDVKSTKCGKKAQRRAVILATGYGGINGARRYKKHDGSKC